MLQVTARVFDNNQLVGYQITDGSQTQLFTRQQAWTFAKNKQLINVVATGDETNPGLSGTNGFELKRLPEIKWKEPSSVKTSQKFTFNTQDLNAALIRNAVNTGNYDMEKKVAKEYLKADVNNGVVTPQNCRTLSNLLLVENTLFNSKSKWAGGGTIALASYSPTKIEKKIIDEFAPMYATIRLTADIVKELMELKHTDSITIKDIEDAKINGELELMKSLENYKQSGHGVADLEKGLDKLTKLLEVLKIFKHNDNSSKTFTKDIIDKLDDALNEIKTRSKDKKGLTHVPKVIGYKVKNLSSRSIAITRMKSTPDHSISYQTALNPGQSMCLNRAEMALLASKPEIDCTFANGRLVRSSNIRAQVLYDFLESYCFSFTKLNTDNRYELETPKIQDGLIPYNPNIMVDVTELVSDNTANTYFTPLNNNQA